MFPPLQLQTRSKQVLEKYNLRPAAVVNTHGHFDHIACDDKFAVPIYIHAEDAVLLKDPQLNLSNFLDSSFRVKSEVKSLKDKDNQRRIEQ